MAEPPVGGRAEEEERLDIHNTSVDQVTAEAGRCGRVDLRTGSMCRLPALHEGGCDFSSPTQITGTDRPR